MTILAISGSLREESTNTRLVEAAVSLSGESADVKTSRLIGSLPLFNPDLDAGAIEVVCEWTHLMNQADALMISTPEYARGYPGALKNALDWLVQGDGFIDKPFCFLMASSRAEHSHKTLATVLETMSGIYIKDADATVHLLGTHYSTEEIVAHPQFSATIMAALTELRSAIKCPT